MTQGGAFLGRQPILEGHSIFGYEFFFRGTAGSTSADFDDDLEACTRVMLNIMTDMGSPWLFGDKLAFINISRRTLHSDFIIFLPPSKVVLELVDGMDEVDIERVRELRADGYAMCVDLPVLIKYPFLSDQLVQYVKCDARNMEYFDISGIAKSLQKNGIVCIADKVETEKQKHLAESFGFKHFQGYFFAHPETFETKSIQPSNAVILDLLGRVIRGEDVARIEEGFKRDVMLSFGLLKYINSASVGLSVEVKSIRHALAVLGSQQLYRWLTLLLVTSGTSSNTALAKTALTRGKLCELIGGDSMNGDQKDNLFLVGVFSMLDVLLGTSMESLLESVAVLPEVRAALIGDGSVYTPFLDIARACEGNETARIFDLSKSHGLSPEFINKSHIEAIAWAESIVA